MEINYRKLSTAVATNAINLSLTSLQVLSYNESIDPFVLTSSVLIWESIDAGPAKNGWKKFSSLL